MKLTMEIKDDKFFYNYKIGEVNTQHGEMDLCADNLTWFCGALEQCHRLFTKKINADMKEWQVLAYIEKHPEIINHSAVKKGRKK